MSSHQREVSRDRQTNSRQETTRIAQIQTRTVQSGVAMSGRTRTAHGLSFSARTHQPLFPRELPRCPSLPTMEVVALRTAEIQILTPLSLICCVASDLTRCSRSVCSSVSLSISRESCWTAAAEEASRSLFRAAWFVSRARAAEEGLDAHNALRIRCILCGRSGRIHFRSTERRGSCAHWSCSPCRRPS